MHAPEPPEPRPANPVRAAPVAPAKPVTPVKPVTLSRWRVPRQAYRPDTEAVRRAGRVAAAEAAQAARTAAYRGTRPIVNFFAGIGCFFRGLWRFLTSPTLWLIAAVPVALVVAAMIAVTASVEAGAGLVADGITFFVGGWPQWTRSLISAVLHLGAHLAVHAVLGYLVLPLSIVLGAPCYVLLARRVERLTGVAVPASPPPLWRAWGLALRRAVLVTLVVQFGWLLLVPVLLIPGINVLLALGAVVIFNGFLVGLLILAIPLHYHGVSTFRAQWAMAWRHRASVIGFGATSAVLLSVPATPVRAIVAPIVFTGAVLLHQRMRPAAGSAAFGSVDAPAVPSSLSAPPQPALPPAGA